MQVVTTAISDSGMIATAREMAYNATAAVILNFEIAKTIMTKRTAAMKRKWASFVKLLSDVWGRDVRSL
jgi:hypothetical protein